MPKNLPGRVLKLLFLALFIIGPVHSAESEKRFATPKKKTLTPKSGAVGGFIDVKGGTQATPRARAAKAAPAATAQTTTAPLAGVVAGGTPLSVGGPTTGAQNLPAAPLDGSPAGSDALPQGGQSAAAVVGNSATTQTTAQTNTQANTGTTQRTPEESSGNFQEIDIGLLPTLGQLYGVTSAHHRPALKLAGGKGWAIKMIHKGSGMGAFPLLLGGTNGFPTGGGKYNYKAAFSKRAGVVSGPDALCVVQMTNAAYTTCEQPCSMQWELRFGTPRNQRGFPGTCELERDQLYYLNIKPVGDGCVDGRLTTAPPSPARASGCPLVMEIANGGHGLLNPGGMGPYCAHLGWRYDAARGGCVE